MNNLNASIGIDCRFWGTKHAGLGRYTRELVLALLNSSSDCRYTLFFQKNEHKQDALLLKNARIIEVTIPHYSVQEQVNFWRYIDQEKLDLMHFTHFNVPLLTRTPYIVTIHDLIKHFFKGREVTTRKIGFYWLKHFGYKLTIQQAVTRACHIITPSDFTKQQIATAYPGQADKTSVIYEGVSSPFNDHTVKQNKVLSTQVLKKYQLTKPYCIYTGSAYPSKNLPVLLEGVKRVITNNPGFLLIIACARNLFWERIRTEVKKLGLEASVRMPGNISDNDLVSLYQQATAFVMPSLMEGFGLPALEAMASGCPVIASKAGSLPEIYGQAALYFDPSKPEELAQSLSECLLMKDSERKNLIKRGQEHSKNYTWGKAALHTEDVYKKCLST